MAEQSATLDKLRNIGAARPTPRVPQAHTPLPSNVVAADLVADTANGADQRAIRARVDLSPQVVNVHVHDIGQRIAVHSPHSLDNASSGDRLTWIAQ